MPPQYNIFVTEFRILKQSSKSRARAGILKTPHGEVETPCLIPVATQAAVKTLTPEEAAAVGSQMLICNTYHLHLKPGEQIVKKAGGLHKFMNWPSPLMTDSAGFQVFSLGFGKDLGTGKILSEKGKKGETVQSGQQPAFLKITEDGVWFRSIVDGKKLFIGPKESIKIQEALGADIMFAFDECTSPLANHAYTKRSLERTHRWAGESLKARKSRQALYGIVQGGKFKDLRQESAEVIGGMDFDGFGIGGEFGDSKKTMVHMLRWVIGELPGDIPRHLLGIGHPEDILPIIKEGVDTFDCIAPTHYARHGTAFTSAGKIDIIKLRYLTDKKPLDSKCSCQVCGIYTRSYLCHLMRAKELLVLRLLTIHNLWYFNALVERIREGIKNGKI